MEGEDADGNTEVEQVEAQTILIVAAVGAVIAVAAAVGLLVLLLKRNKITNNRHKDLNIFNLK